MIALHNLKGLQVSLGMNYLLNNAQVRQNSLLKDMQYCNMDQGDGVQRH